MRRSKHRLRAIGRFRPFKANYSCLMKPADDQKIFLGCQLNILRRKRLARAGMRLVAIAEPAAGKTMPPETSATFAAGVNWMRTTKLYSPSTKKKSRNAKPGARCFCFLECDRSLQPLRHLHDCSDGFRWSGCRVRLTPTGNAAFARRKPEAAIASPMLWNLRCPLANADTSERQLLENFGPSEALSPPRVTSGRFVDRAPWSATRRRGAPRGLLTPC